MCHQFFFGFILFYDIYRVSRKNPTTFASNKTFVVIARFSIFTHEYTKCTAGSTFCFVVVVLVVVLVVVRKPLIKLAGISADMTVDQT
jgi:hypothetical protein